MYDTILVAIDGSACGHRALVEAIELASAVHARLEVVHVIESGFETEIHAELVRKGRELLDGARAAAEQRGVQCVVKLEDAEQLLGDVASAISQALVKTQAKLLVLGTHGRTGLNRLLMGSVAEKLVRNASTPVLLVRLDSNA